jgi:hypothetical protein
VHRKEENAKVPLAGWNHQGLCLAMILQKIPEKSGCIFHYSVKRFFADFNWQISTLFGRKIAKSENPTTPCVF